jgi:glycosyltransferase involved in cell wall biosynthesis
MTAQPLPLRSECEVMASWRLDGPPQVSVLCSTYNHIAFLADAIAGMMAQITTFPFEVILKDDASTDGTADLVRSFAKRYPCIIRIHCNSSNEYHLGKRGRRFLEMARGRYLATCEGDDYWIHPFKLQLQWELLEANPKLIFCGGLAQVGSMDASVNHKIGPRSGTTRFTAEDLILHDFIHTSTFFCRAWAQRWLFNNFHASVSNGDRVKRVVLASLGEAGFIHEVFSFYRIHSGGAWTSLRPKARFERQVITDREINRFTAGRYHRHLFTYLRANYREALRALHADHGYKSVGAVPSMLLTSRCPQLLIDTLRFYCRRLLSSLRSKIATLAAPLRG